MPRADEVMHIYEDLAQVYEQQGQPKLRDWFLVLAADVAAAAGWSDEAERLRLRLLGYNPHHLLKPFTSFTEALKSPDIQSYISDLRRTYPPETAEQLLHKNSAGSAARPAPPSEMTRDVFSLEPNGSREEPQVYKLPGVSEAAKPAAAPRLAAPRPVSLPPLPAAPPRPAPAAPTAAPPRELTVPKSAKIPRPNEVNGLSAWISAMLFVLLLLAGLALAVYTLGQPFFVE